MDQHAGRVSTSLTISTLEVAGVLHVKDPRMIVLLDGALSTENEVDRPAVSTLKGVGLNLAVLLGEVLHLLQDGVITELRAGEQHDL